jgi:hypothetical protein
MDFRQVVPARARAAPSPARGGSVLARLARDGAYHSQFVTGTGNGGLTAPRATAGCGGAGSSAGPAPRHPVTSGPSTAP